MSCINGVLLEKIFVIKVPQSHFVILFTVAHNNRKRIIISGPCSIIGDPRGQYTDAQASIFTPFCLD